MTVRSKAVAKELRGIRQVCEELGADEEMTALVLASHRHDRSRLDVIVAAGGTLLDYVRFKLAIWETIFSSDAAAPGAH